MGDTRDFVLVIKPQRRQTVKEDLQVQSEAINSASYDRRRYKQDGQEDGHEKSQHLVTDEFEQDGVLES